MGGKKNLQTVLQAREVRKGFGTRQEEFSLKRGIRARYVFKPIEGL